VNQIESVSKGVNSKLASENDIASKDLTKLREELEEANQEIRSLEFDLSSSKQAVSALNEEMRDHQQEIDKYQLDHPMRGWIESAGYSEASGTYQPR